MLTSKMQIPQKKINNDMPLPGPEPNKGLNMRDSRLDCVFIAGSSKKSDNVPPMIGEIGLVNQAIKRRAEKTRPCKSGATFACQIA